MTYRKRSLIVLLTIPLFLFSVSPAVLAALTPPEPGVPEALAFVRLKITGDEYVEIQNNSGEDIDDLSIYSLKAYNNVNSAAANTTGSSQAFPALKLELGARLLLSSTIRPTCGAGLAGKLSVSLVDGGGTLQIIKASEGSSDSAPAIEDSVNWSNSSKGAIPLVPSFSKSPLTTYYRYGFEDGPYAWQKTNQDINDTCRLVIPATVSSPAIALDIFSPEQQYDGDTLTVGLEDVDEPDTQEPVSAIEISELLPNPSGSGNDATDEYIELYNPNPTAFDVSGYKLRSGISTLRHYTFPSGSSLEAGSYLTVYAHQTGLALSNTIGQVAFLDSADRLLASTDVYRAAKDGQSWLRHNGVWQWSVTPTPGNANTATPPASIHRKTSDKISTGKKSLKSAAPKPAKKQKAPKAPKVKKEKQAKTDKPSKLQTIPTAATVESKPIQFRIIAIIALIALLYGAYEYRGDLANKYRQCRRHISSWRPRRRSAEGR